MAKKVIPFVDSFERLAKLILSVNEVDLKLISLAVEKSEELPEHLGKKEFPEKLWKILEENNYREVLSIIFFLPIRCAHPKIIAEISNPLWFNQIIERIENKTFLMEILMNVIGRDELEKIVVQRLEVLADGPD